MTDFRSEEGSQAEAVLRIDLPSSVNPHTLMGSIDEDKYPSWCTVCAAEFSYRNDAHLTLFLGEVEFGPLCERCALRDAAEIKRIASESLYRIDEQIRRARWLRGRIQVVATAREITSKSLTSVVRQTARIFADMQLSMRDYAARQESQSELQEMPF